MTTSMTFEQTRKSASSVLRELHHLHRKVVGQESSALDELMRRTKQPLFTLAITGPSRVGKSSLINALLGRQVCPVGPLPKTAVPALFEPADSEALVVTMRDGTDVISEVAPEQLEAWVSTEQNPDNRKQVARVKVQVKSGVLELGFSIIDLPGLDDPNDSVRASTDLALDASDAVVYVLNGGAYASGSFILTASDRAQLTRLIPKMNKTFVALNKADLLDVDQRTELREYLCLQFAKFRLMPLTEENLFFVSAKDAVAVAGGKAPHNRAREFMKLMEAVTDHMIQHGLTGRSRLKGILSEATQLVNEQVAVISLPLAKANEAAKLRSYLDRFKGTSERVESICKTGLVASEDLLRGELEVFVDRSAARFRKALAGTPFIESLPSRPEVRVWLQGELERLVSHGQAVCQKAFQDAADDANRVVREVMDSLRADVARLIRANLGQGVDMGLGSAAELNLWTPFWGTLGLGLGGLVFGPIGAVVGALIGFLGGLLISEQERRRREIETLTARVTRVLNDSSTRVHSQLSSSLVSAFNDLEGGLQTRINESGQRLEGQLAALGEIPSATRVATLRSALSDLAKIRDEAGSILARL